ncbi:synaptophysin-like protein 1 [Strix aluco]|uniref:synaptophysin-like protein 1 n=1 Tax=Strix aluco TaxID=111821 RepID=UPI003DA629E5
MSGLRVDLGPAKEPLGLVRGLQWFFSIFAFATCGGYSGAVSFLVSCGGQSNVTVTAPFAYPFRLNQATFTPALPRVCNRTWATDVHLVGDFSSGAQFFVAVAALAFVYSAAALALYLGALQRYRGAGGALPLADFLATVAFSFLWLVSSSAWAKALTDVKTSTTAPLPNCPSAGTTCGPPGVTPMGSLNVSVIFGFLNLVLWVGSSWFVYKETNFHRRPRPPPPPAPPQPPCNPAPSPFRGRGSTVRGLSPLCPPPHHSWWHRRHLESFSRRCHQIFAVFLGCFQGFFVFFFWYC